MTHRGNAGQLLLCKSGSQVHVTVQETNFLQNLGRNAAAISAAALMSLGSISGPALATEFDVINTSTPSLNYLIDDANVLNKTTKKSVNDRLYKLEVSALV